MKTLLFLLLFTPKYPCVVFNACTGKYAIKVAPHSYLGVYLYHINSFSVVKLGSEVVFQDSLNAKYYLEQYTPIFDMKQSHVVDSVHAKDKEPKCHYLPI